MMKLQQLHAGIHIMFSQEYRASCYRVQHVELRRLWESSRIPTQEAKSDRLHHLPYSAHESSGNHGAYTRTSSEKWPHSFERPAADGS